MNRKHHAAAIARRKKAAIEAHQQQLLERFILDIEVLYIKARMSQISPEAAEFIRFLDRNR